MRLFLPGIFLSLLLSFSMTSAHGGGATFTSESNGYYIDVDYSDANLVAERSGQFVFRLFEDEERLSPAEVSSVWARIERNTDDKEQTLFASYMVAPEFGEPSMLYVFPHGGQYTLHIRYYRDGEEIAETSFPLEVEHLKRPWYTRLLNFYIWLGVLVGLVLGFAVARFAGSRLHSGFRS